MNKVNSLAAYVTLNNKHNESVRELSIFLGSITLQKESLIKHTVYSLSFGSDNIYHNELSSVCKKLIEHCMWHYSENEVYKQNLFSNKITDLPYIIINSLIGKCDMYRFIKSLYNVEDNEMDDFVRAVVFNYTSTTLKRETLNNATIDKRRKDFLIADGFNIIEPLLFNDPMVTSTWKLKRNLDGIPVVVNSDLNQPLAQLEEDIAKSTAYQIKHIFMDNGELRATIEQTQQGFFNDIERGIINSLINHRNYGNFDDVVLTPVYIHSAGNNDPKGEDVVKIICFKLLEKTNTL
jgi:hypothetical protein